MNFLIKKFWITKDTYNELYRLNSNYPLSFCDNGFRLTLDVKMNQKNDLYIFIELFDTNNQDLVNMLNDDESKRLLSLVNSHINNIINEKEEKKTSTITFDSKSVSFIISSISISQLKNIRQFFKKIANLKSISVYSIYRLRGEEHIIAKTLIELDADILTVVSDQIQQFPNYIQLIKIHMISTMLTNHLFFYPLKKISYFILSLRRIMPFIATGYWILFIHSLSLNFLDGSMVMGISWNIFNYAFMPSLAFFCSRYAIKLIIRKIIS